MIVISDIHGCYWTLIRLLNQCAKLHPGEKLAFLGDLIDRGPNSRAVVEFAMTNAIPTTQGNHESLCLAYSAHTRRGYSTPCARYYDRDVWLFNGGEVALANWPHYRPTEDQGVPFRDGEHIPDEVLDWMQALPAYIDPDAPPDENGLRLHLSHTGYGLYGELGHWHTALWGRHGLDAPEFPEDGRYRVLGHTPCKQPIIERTFANIDTGAAYGSRGGGTMTAFIWPSKTIVQQAFDETPVATCFKIVDGALCP